MTEFCFLMLKEKRSQLQNKGRFQLQTGEFTRRICKEEKKKKKNAQTDQAIQRFSYKAALIEEEKIQIRRRS